MCQIIFCSLFLPNHFEKFSENIMRIMWTWRSFRVELHTEDRFIFQPQTFQQIIVQTLISDFHFVFIQIAFSDAVVVILRGDEHFTDSANVEQGDSRRDVQI